MVGRAVMWRRWAAVTTVTALLAAGLVSIRPLAASAAPSRGTLPVRRSMSSYYLGQTATGAWNELSYWRSGLCAKTPGLEVSAHLSQAALLNKAWGFVARKQGAKLVSTFRARAKHRSVATLSQQMLADILSKRTYGALAALLALEGNSSSVTRRFDIASLLSAVGQSRLARAFLDSIPKGATPATTGGVLGSAALDTTAGTVDLELGSYKAAEAKFAAALSVQPSLHQADAGRSISALCRGQKASATHFYNLGVHAGNFDDAIPVNPPPPVQVEPPVYPMLGAGDTLQISTISVPADVPALAAQTESGDYERYTTQQGQALTAIQRRQVAYHNAWQHDLANRPSATRHWDDALIQAASYAGDLKSIQDLYQTAFNSAFELTQDVSKFGCCAGTAIATRLYAAQQSCADAEDYYSCFDPKCKAIGDPGVATMVGLANSTITQWQKVSVAEYRTVTAMSSLTTDPNLTTWILLQAQVDAVYYLLQESTAAEQTGDVGDSWFQTCWQSPAPTGKPVDGTTHKPQKPGKCSDDWAIKLAVASIEADCDELTIGVETPGVGPFGEVGYNFGTRDLTVYGGVHAGGNVGPIEGDAKIGAYVDIDSNGIEDPGIRAKGSISVGEGVSAGVNLTKDWSMMDSPEEPVE